MYEYKTVVRDYEGMQEALETYGGQGWRLKQVTPDTWRFTNPTMMGIGFNVSTEDPETSETRELSASYYLLIFERETELGGDRILAAEEEARDYTLPEL